VVSVALGFNLIMAVGVGLVLAIILFVSNMSRSLVRNVFRGPAFHSRSAWDERRQAVLERVGHRIAVLELEGALFFGTADGLDDKIYRLIGEGVTHVVLDMKRIKDVDSTGALVLQRIRQRLANKGGCLAVSYVLKERRQREAPFSGEDRRSGNSPRHLWRFLKDTGTVRALGDDMFFTDTDGALAACENHLIDTVSDDIAKGIDKARRIMTAFRGLTAQEVRILRRAATRLLLPAGATIFRQGDRGDALYLITRGKAEVYLHLESGEEKRLQALPDGAIFGEMAVLDNKPRAATVVAVEDSVCYRLGVEEFEKLKNNEPAIALKLFNNLCLIFSDRIRAANAMITELEK
jgi:anti-anti-sigma regulatory factor